VQDAVGRALHLDDAERARCWASHLVPYVSGPTVFAACFARGGDACTSTWCHALGELMRRRPSAVVVVSTPLSWTLNVEPSGNTSSPDGL